MLKAFPTPFPDKISSVAPTLKGLMITKEFLSDFFANAFKNLKGNNLNPRLSTMFLSLDKILTVYGDLTKEIKVTNMKK